MTLRPAPVLRAARRAPFWVLSIYVIGALAFAGLFVSAFVGHDLELLQGLIVAPVLLGLTLPIAFRVARSEGDPQYVGYVMAAVIVKLLSALVRYWVSFVYYKGYTDAAQYDIAGRLYAPSLRRLIYPSAIGSIQGTGFLRLLTSIIYAIFGSSRIAGGFAFAWLGFLGLVLITRAFRIGIPNGAVRRYTLLILFLPGLLYWPAAIGKEAWMLLALGLTAFGVAGLFRQLSSSILALVAGLGAMIMVRPHLALIVFVGIVFAFLVRKAPARSYAAPILRLLGLAAVIVLGLFLVSQTASFLGQESLTSETISAELSQAGSQTSDGGSQFTPVQVNTPIDMAPAFATVFFRPFPFEAGSPQELVAAAECTFILGLFIFSWNRLRSIPKLIRVNPYLAYCIGYVLAFSFAFASFANFGILARQRVQAVPFLLVLVALPRIQDLMAPAPQEPETPAALAVVPPITATLVSGTSGKRRQRRPAPPV